MATGGARSTGAGTAGTLSTKRRGSRQVHMTTTFWFTLRKIGGGDLFGIPSSPSVHYPHYLLPIAESCSRWGESVLDLAEAWFWRISGRGNC